VCSNVTFSELSEAEIAYYVDTYNPMDKAGAYGIQEWIGMVGIKHLDGCFFNVMGLPLHTLYQYLKKF
jgi:septum formation protein